MDDYYNLTILHCASSLKHFGKSFPVSRLDQTLVCGEQRSVWNNMLCMIQDIFAHIKVEI